MVDELLPEVRIIDLGHDGRGVGKVNGFTIFIPGVLPGEMVRARLIKKKKHFGEALPEEILDQSPHRREPPCPVYPECGGCQLQHMEYPFQVEFKKDRLNQALYRIGEVKSFPSPKVFAANKEWGYRNKATYHLQGNRVGFFGQKSRRVIPHEKCALLPTEANQIKRGIEELFQSKRFSAGKDLTVRTSFSHKQSLLILGSTIKTQGSWESIINPLKEKTPDLIGIYQQGKGKKGGHLIWGKGKVEEKMGNYTFQLGPETFFQVNPEQREVLLKKIREIVQDRGFKKIADLYSGAGAFGINLTDIVEKVMAIEISREAVEEGIRLAEEKNLENVEFHQGEVEKEFSKLPRDLDCVLLDPPREGCHPSVLQLIEEKNVKSLIYISCNPSTLARDIAVLRPNGYGVETIDLIDMFPQTYHVECLVLMSKGEN